MAEIADLNWAIAELVHDGDADGISCDRDAFSAWMSGHVMDRAPA